MIIASKNWTGSLLRSGAGRGLISADDMAEIGATLCLRIARRTRAGVAPNGGTFPAYSAKYAAAKAKEVGAGPVNLTLSGQMLNDLRVVASTPNSIEIGFSTFGPGSRTGTMIQRSRSMGANDKAFYATEGSHGKIRDFLDLSDEDEQFIADAIDQVIGDALAAEGAA